MEYLNLEDLLELMRVLGAGPVRDPGLLESAAARPATTIFGSDAYPDLATKAAALLQSICSNHALVDGNKRLAWLGAVVFLDLNGQSVVMTQDEAFDLVMAVASSSVDLEAIADRLRSALMPRARVEE